MFRGVFNRSGGFITDTVRSAKQVLGRHRGLEPRSLQRTSFALPDELMAVRR
jgi:hypothetical protein